MPDPNEMTCVRPIGLFSDAGATSLCADGFAIPLAGGPLVFTHGELITRGKSGRLGRRYLAGGLIPTSM